MIHDIEALKKFVKNSIHIALEKKDNYCNYAEYEYGEPKDYYEALYKTAEYEHDMFSQLFDYIEDTEKKLNRFNLSKENEEGIKACKVLKVLMFDRLQTEPEDYVAVINKCLNEPYAAGECIMSSTLNLESYNNTETTCKYNGQLHSIDNTISFVFADKMYNIITPDDEILCITEEDFEKNKNEYEKNWSITEYFPDAYQFILSGKLQV